MLANTTIWLRTAIEQPLPEQELVDRGAAPTNGIATSDKSRFGLVTFRAIAIDFEISHGLSDVALFREKNPPPIHSRNSHTLPTSIVDGSLLLCHFGEHGAAGFTCGGSGPLTDRRQQVSRYPL